jgi:hypothetical protein
VNRRLGQALDKCLVAVIARVRKRSKTEFCSNMTGCFKQFVEGSESRVCASSEESDQFLDAKANI